MITNIEFCARMEDLIKKINPDYEKSIDSTTDDFESLNRAVFAQEMARLMENYSSGGGGGGAADDITYDGTSSGLEATNVQDAIDELAGGVTPVDVVPDLVISGTFSENLNDTAFEGFTYDFKEGLTIDDIIDKIEATGNIDIKSLVYRPMDDGSGNVLLKQYAPIFDDQTTILITTDPNVAAQVVELNHERIKEGTNAVTIGLCGGAAFWAIEEKSGGGSYDLKTYAKKMLIFENKYIAVPAGESAPTFAPGRYYSRSEDTYTMLTTEPQNWTTNYTDYYELNTERKLDYVINAYIPI